MEIFNLNCRWQWKMLDKGVIVRTSDNKTIGTFRIAGLIHPSVNHLVLAAPDLKLALRKLLELHQAGNNVDPVEIERRVQFASEVLESTK